MSTSAANTLYHIKQYLNLSVVPVNTCWVTPALLIYLQGMFEWEQECRAAEVDGLQLALNKQRGHPVLKPTTVSDLCFFLLDELILVVLSWQVTVRACAVSLTACTPVIGQLQDVPYPSLSCLQSMSY